MRVAARTVDPAYQLRLDELRLRRSRTPFFFLAGFIATQGFLVPLVALPVNWAVWPNLPDVFGICLFLSVLTMRHRPQPGSFDRVVFKNVAIMLAAFALNLLLVTLPLSETGAGVKFGSFSVILLVKYLAVLWAATRVPIDEERIKVIHYAALASFVWLTGVVLADRAHLIDLNIFVKHLPRARAGKWAPGVLDSTVSTNHGGTTVVILMLAALVLATVKDRSDWRMYVLVTALALPAVFVSGSRQGIVRILAFGMTLFLRQPKKLLLVLLLLAALSTVIPFVLDTDVFLGTDKAQMNISRQAALIRDPLSDEGLSGRPQLWLSVLETLNEKPYRWVVGYGLGNYVEFRNSAHNMFLQMAQDGGLIFVFLISGCWIGIFRNVWAYKHRSWVMVALTAGLLSSVMTSGIFYPNLATGWYLGTYFVILHILMGKDRQPSAGDSGTNNGTR